MPPTNDPPPICPRYLPLISTSTTTTTAADQVKSFCRGSRLRPPDARLYIAFQIDERQERDDQDTEFCELYEQEGGDVEQDVPVFHGWRNGVAHCSGGQSYRTRYVFLGLVGGRGKCPLLAREAKMGLGGLNGIGGGEGRWNDH